MMIRSEKELYKDTLLDVASGMDTEVFVWGEDLVDKKLIVYPKKLKEIKGYKDVKAQLILCGVVLIDVAKKDFMRCISAMVNTENGNVYISEAVFNNIWKILRKSVNRGIKIARENGESLISRPEEIVSMEQLMRSGSSPIIEKYMIKYVPKKLTEEERYRNSRKQSLLDNPQLLYYYAGDGRYFHDKECEDIVKISPEQFEASETMPDREICPKCQSQLYFRKACYPNTKQIQICNKIFKEQKVSNGRIRHFVIEVGMKFHATSLDELQVEGVEDHWLVKGLRTNKLELWHNNYIRTSPTERYITEGYHTQKIEAHTLTQMLNYIEHYSFEKHLQHEKLEKQGMEQKNETPMIGPEKQNELTETKEKEPKNATWYVRVWRWIRELF